MLFPMFHPKMTSRSSHMSSLLDLNYLMVWYISIIVINNVFPTHLYDGSAETKFLLPNN